MSATIFNYKRPDSSAVDRPVEKKQSPIDVFSFKKPESISFEEENIPEEPKSFTQSIYEQMKESEDLERQVERGAARTTSRTAETIIGLPGDLHQFLSDITGYKTKDYETFLPTSSGLQDISEKITGGYTSPENEFEEKIDQGVKDIASTLYGGGVKSLAHLMASKIGTPIVGNLVHEGVLRATGDEKKALKAKLGTMLALDLATSRQTHGVGGSGRFVSKLFQGAEESIPKGSVTNAKKLESSVQTLKNDLLMGGTSPSKSDALKKIDEILSKIHGGQIDPKEFPAFRVAINELIETQGGWNIGTPPRIKQRTINNLQDVKRQVIQSGEDYGRTQNPMFSKLWKSANEASAVRSQSQHIANFIKKNFGDKIKSKAIPWLFGIGGASYGLGKGAALATTGAKLAGVTAPLSAIYKGTQVLQRVIQSPTLRFYYSEVIKHAMEENIPKMIKSMKALDATLEKEEDKESKFIDDLIKDRT